MCVFAGQNQCEVICKYVPGQDRILFCDGQAIGVRSDYNGVLLLDSILQKPVTNTKDDVKLELLLSEVGFCIVCLCVCVLFFLAITLSFYRRLY